MPTRALLAPVGVPLRALVEPQNPRGVPRPGSGAITHCSQDDSFESWFLSFGFLVCGGRGKERSAELLFLMRTMHKQRL